MGQGPPEKERGADEEEKKELQKGKNEDKKGNAGRNEGAPFEPEPMDRSGDRNDNLVSLGIEGDEGEGESENEARKSGDGIRDGPGKAGPFISV